MDMDQPNVSRLLALPPELQECIYSYIVQPWSLAMFIEKDFYYIPSDVFLDHKSLLDGRNKAQVIRSGKELALTCRTIYQLVLSLHTKLFDGRMYIGYYFPQLHEYPHQLWLSKVKRLYCIALSHILSPSSLGLLRNVKHFELIIKEERGNPGIHRLGNASALNTVDAETIHSIATPHIYDLLDKLRKVRRSWDNETADPTWGVVIDIHILHSYYGHGWQSDDEGFAAGFIVRWAYGEQEIIARAAWGWDMYFAYWKKGMEVGTMRQFGFTRASKVTTMNDVPEWLHWVMTTSAQQERMKAVAKNPSLRWRFGHHLRCSCSKRVPKRGPCAFHDETNFGHWRSE